MRDSGDTLVHKTAYAYSPDNNSVTTTVGTGDDAVTTKVFTDTTGAEVLRLANGETEKTIFSRNQQGLLRQIIDPLSHVTTIEYDALDRPSRTTRPDNSVEILYYDWASNVTGRIMNSALGWEAGYDSAGRQTYEVTYYNGSTFTRLLSHIYHPTGVDTGLRDTTSDQRGVIFTHAYDDFRRLESITAAGSLPEQTQSIAWTYDNRGIPQTITQTGGGQPDSTITRDISPYGQIGNESVSFDGGTTSFSQSWDGAGRRASLGAGPGFGYGFNAAGQLTSVSAGGSSYNSYFTTAGLLSSRSNPFRTQTVTDRDGAGRVLTQTVTAGSATPLSETQTWLDDGRLDTYSAVRDGANAWNESRDYGYDARGQVLTETFAPGPGATATLNYTFSTNKLGIRTAAKVGAGGNTNWYFNAVTLNTLGRVAQFSDNTGTRTVPTSGDSFGAASVKLEVDGVAGPSASHPGWQDAAGNWTADLQLTPGLHTLTARGVHPSGWLSDPATSTFTVTGAPQTMTPGFDSMGNVTSRTWSGGKVQTLTWDAFGRLAKVVQTGVEPFTWTAAYDGLGRRLRTTHTPSGGSAFVVNSSFDPQAEFLEVGVNINGAQNWRVNGPDLNGAFGSLNGTGGLEAVISPTGTTGTINDVFGNVVASVGANSTVTWSPTKVGSYGPLPQYETKTLESGASLIEVSTWRTRRADPTGLVNMGARHLGQKEGQFISADPLGHGSSWSLYDFSNGDGVNNFDADGRVARQAILADGQMRSAVAQGITDFAMWDLKFVSGALGFLRPAMTYSTDYGNGDSTESYQHLASLSSNDFSPTNLVLNSDLSINPEKLGSTLSLLAIPALLESSAPFIERPTNFVPIQSAEKPMITVIGSLEDTGKFVGQKGYNTLNVPDPVYKAMSPQEFDRLNAEWLNASVQRGDVIAAVTDPAAHAARLESIQPGLSQSSRFLNLELPMMQEYGILPTPLKTAP